MAIRTKVIASFDDGHVVWYEDYDDAQLRITQVRCTNNCQGHQNVDTGQLDGWATKATLTVLSNGRTYTATVQPGQTLTQDIPTGAQARLDITIDARGRVNGVDYSVQHQPGLI
jgi:hypothetical protein